MTPTGAWSCFSRMFFRCFSILARMSSPASLGKVCQRDLAVLSGAERRNEQQVVELPRGAFGAVGRRPLLYDKVGEDLAERDHRQAFWLEIDEENAPGLVGRQWPKLLDIADFSGFVWLQAEFLGREVERQIVETLRLNWPVEFIAKVLDQRWKVVDCSELVVGFQHEDDLLAWEFDN